MKAVDKKVTNGLYDQSLHDSFKPSKFNIEEIELIISSIENKLRKIEIIYYSYFDSEYDPSIIVNNSMPLVGGLITNKVIETEFYYATNILKNRININTPELYKEFIDTNFRSMILMTASLYESIVKLTETLIKKIVLYDGKNLPSKSILLKVFILNWDKLVYLGYRKNDDFYDCYINHRTFIDKYLDQINLLRNSFIHGYSVNLEIDSVHREYVVTNRDTANFKPISGSKIIDELVLNKFTNEILVQTRRLTTDILDLFVIKLSRATKLPM